MTKIFAHIAGLNDSGKQAVIDAFSKKEYYVLDLDDVTSKIIEDKHMIYMFERYEYYLEKQKDLNLTKLQQKQMSIKVKVLERDMNLYWKKKLDNAILDVLESTYLPVILIGYSTYFKNHRIGINIKSSFKFFQKLNLIEHAKHIVSVHLEEHKNDIINGTFPLDYLNHSFIIKKRDNISAQYQKMGYHLDTINNIINSLYIALNEAIPNTLYYASTENFVKKLPLTNGKIVAYEDDWIALVSALNNKNIIKGFTANNKPFVRAKESDLSKELYLYMITDTSGFSPVPSKNKVYKYQSAKQPTFKQKMNIYDVLTKLNEMQIKVELI